jgi:hypothetical protein
MHKIKASTLINWIYKSKFKLNIPDALQKEEKISDKEYVPARHARYYGR